MDSLNKFLKNITGFQYYFILSLIQVINTWFINIISPKFFFICFLILSFFRIKKLKTNNYHIIIFYIFSLIFYVFSSYFGTIITSDKPSLETLFLIIPLYVIVMVFKLIFKNAIKIKTSEKTLNIVLFLLAIILAFILPGIGLQLKIYEANDLFSGRSLAFAASFYISTYVVYFIRTLIYKTSLYKRFFSKEIIKKPPAQNHSKYEPKTKKQNISLDNSKELFQTFKNEDHSNYMPNQPNEEIIPKRLNFKDFKSVGFVNFYNGLPYTGIGFELNKEGNIKTEFNLVNGIKEGKAIEFYDNGSVKIETFYTNNKVNGLSTTFFKNGKVKSKASFDNGKLADIKSDIELNKETKSNSKISKEDAKNKLLELKEYLDLGIITQDEFDEKAKPLKKILLGN